MSLGLTRIWLKTTGVYNPKATEDNREKNPTKHTGFSKVWKSFFLTEHHLVSCTGQGRRRQTTVLVGKERRAQVCNWRRYVWVNHSTSMGKIWASLSAFCNFMDYMNGNILIYIEHKWKVTALITWYFNSLLKYLKELKEKTIHLLFFLEKWIYQDK